MLRRACSGEDGRAGVWGWAPRLWGMDGGKSSLSRGGIGLAFWDWEVIILVAFSVPDEPIQPIDPAAWVSHSAALTGTFPAYPGSSSMSTITSGSSLPDGEPPGPPHPTPSSSVMIPLLLGARACL